LNAGCDGVNLTQWAMAQGVRVKVLRFLADPRVATVLVEHRDWLGRMNTEIVEFALQAHGRWLIVID
jgi:putative resolvase